MSLHSVITDSRNPLNWYQRMKPSTHTSNPSLTHLAGVFKRDLTLVGNKQAKHADNTAAVFKRDISTFLPQHHTPMYTQEERQFILKHGLPDTRSQAPSLTPAESAVESTESPTVPTVPTVASASAPGIPSDTELMNAVDAGKAEVGKMRRHLNKLFEDGTIDEATRQKLRDVITTRNKERKTWRARETPKDEKKYFHTE